MRPIYCREMRRLLAGLALSAVVVYLSLAIPSALHDSFVQLRGAVATAGLSPLEVRRLRFGRDYVDAMEAIRSAIGSHEPYLIDHADPHGSFLWARFDLLPRPAINARDSALLRLPDSDCWKSQLRWMVIGVGTGRPPRLLERKAPRVPAGCHPAPWQGSRR
jgi:hypothetical protein